MFFGSAFFLYIKARMGPGPYLFPTIFACICIGAFFFPSAVSLASSSNIRHFIHHRRIVSLPLLFCELVPPCIQPEADHLPGWPVHHNPTMLPFSPIPSGSDFHFSIDHLSSIYLPSTIVPHTTYFRPRPAPRSPRNERIIRGIHITHIFYHIRH